MAKKKSEKEKGKKLRSLILLLFLTIVLLATSTYAWFTSNKNVTISNIDVNVTAGGGIQISSDALNWKTIVSNDDILSGYDGDKNVLPAILNPASTDGTVASGYLNMYSGTVLANSTTGEFELTTELKTDAAEKTAFNAVEAGAQYTGYYVAFDVFLKSDNNSPLYLRVGSGAKAGNTDTNIQNATRIAIINEGFMDASTAVANLRAMSGGTTSAIFEPYYQSHTSFGITQAGLYYRSYQYDESSTVGAGIDGATLTAGNGNKLIVTEGVKAAMANVPLAETNTTSATNGSKFAKVTNVTPLDAAFCTGSGNDLLMDMVFPSFTSGGTTISAGTIPAGVTKLRIYLWVEGQDVDCENNASGGALSFNLAFSLDQRTGVTAGS